MNKINLSLIAIAVVLAGCAKSPDEIAAVSIGSGMYSGISCANLSSSLVTARQNLENLSASQRSAATGDAWGVFLLGLPLSSMSGGDNEADIALAKGQIQEMEAEQMRRCNR